MKRTRPLIPSLDGVVKNREKPDTFKIPTEDEKRDIKPGDKVKAGFPTGDPHMMFERMWVLVTDRIGDTLLGMLDNDPITIKAKAGEYVEMEIRHVLDIMKGVEES